MASSSRSKSWCSAVLFLSACASEPQLVASNCDQGERCVTSAALKIDAVDILLVIDDSPSLGPKVAQLKAELPRLLSAITTGEAEALNFPPAKSVHVAVTTTDMGGAARAEEVFCTGDGQDGVFVRPGEVGVTCDVSYPGYLAYEADGAALSVVESASCVPLAFAEPSSGFVGCGFEQPLEAALKALWPGDDASLSFNSGSGHGSAENAGFLRDNSLLVVIVVSDEDDCSVSDRNLLQQGGANNPYLEQAVNLRCHLNSEKLQPTARYIDHLKTLRPKNDNVIFAVIGGIPTELVSDSFRSGYDFNAPEQADRYFADVLDASDMQEATLDEQEPTGRIRPSCTSTVEDGNIHIATPPRRLVEVARGFGAQGVLGSICAADFGATTGHIIRALGEKLSAGASR